MSKATPKKGQAPTVRSVAVRRAAARAAVAASAKTGRPVPDAVQKLASSR